MAGILTYAAAGALGGFGQGLAETGKAKRDAMLRMLEEDRQDNRLAIREKAADERAAARDEAAGKRQDKALASQEDRADQRAGIFTQTVDLVDPDTGKVHTYGVNRQGKKVDLGEAPPPKASGSEPMVQIQDPNDPTRTIYVPRSEAENMSPPKSAKDQEADAEAAAAQDDEVQAQAEKIVSDHAGYLSTDATDFAKFGGSRTSAIEAVKKDLKNGGDGNIFGDAEAPADDQIDMTGTKGNDVTGKGTKAADSAPPSPAQAPASKPIGARRPGSDQGKSQKKAKVLELPKDRKTLQKGVIYQTARGPAEYLGNGQFKAVVQ